jgi:hypothetical protein
MATLHDRPSLVDVYSTPSDFVPESNSVLLFGETPENRVDYVEALKFVGGSTTLVQVRELDRLSFEYQEAHEKRVVQLRSESQLKAMWSRFGNRTIYLDLGGLPHHIWAPLLQSSVYSTVRLLAIYVEPREYRYNVAPTEGDIFDLSERITGISPIPGFASLRDDSDQSFCFVPLLGFEGGRFAFAVEQIQPPGGRIYPIVGIPGFRPEYPFHTYLCNKNTLQETRSWRNVRFAAANDPFALFYSLEEIAEENKGLPIKIATIGTKPHALGAILYAMNRGAGVEIVYDHPIRKAKRTEGVSRLLVYHVSAFLSN